MPRLKLPPARLITLDAYGTIYIPSPSVSEQYFNLYNDYRSRVLPQRQDIDIDTSTSNNSAPPELSAAQININFKKAYKARAASHPNYAGGETEWWIAVIKDTFGFLRPADVDDDDDRSTDRFAREVYENFNSSKAYTVYPDVVPFLTTLLGRNSPPPKIGVISNSDSRSRTILKGLGILSPLAPPPPPPLEQKEDDARYLIANDNDVILSAEVGFDKPDPRIFIAAESKLLQAPAAAAASSSAKLQTAQTDDAIAVARGLVYWHIGDEWDKDIAPLLSTPELCAWGGIFISRIPSSSSSSSSFSSSSSPSSSLDKSASDEERKVTLSAGGRVLSVSDLRDLSALWGSPGVDVVIAE